MAAAPRWTLTRRHDAGFFEGMAPGARMHSSTSLRAENTGGAWDIQDPFRFGPVLGPLDEHLLLEGAHKRLYDRLGAQLSAAHEGVDGTVFAVWGAACAARGAGGRFQ